VIERNVSFTFILTTNVTLLNFSVVYASVWTKVLDHNRLYTSYYVTHILVSLAMSEETGKALAELS
jgi:hypothetical protein